jgi:hypothetical protein
MPAFRCEREDEGVSVHVPLTIQPASHSAEFQALLSCARLTLDPASESRIKALIQQDLDWDFFIVTAHHHRVLPLVCRTFERVRPPGLPDTAIQRLRTAARTTARRNLRLTSELLQIVDSLHRHDIRSIPYKGPVLAAMVYGDISLREFADLDIIVPEKDAKRAITLLSAWGYRYAKETEKDITLRRDDVGIELDLHWGVATGKAPIQIPPELLWSDLHTFSVAGRAVLAHSYETLLLTQCFHGAKHLWEKLGWLCDIAEIVRSQPSLNWSRIVEEATALGGRRTLLVGLTLARELLGAEPPSEVVRLAQRDSGAAALSGQVTRWLLSEQPIPRGEHEHFFVRLQEHSADRVRVALKQVKAFMAPTSRDTDLFAVPKFLTWTLYPLRIVRLVREYGLTPFTRFFRGMFQS